LLLARPGGRQLSLQLSIMSLSRHGMGIVVSSQSFHSHCSHSHSLVRFRSLSLGNGAYNAAEVAATTKRDDNWNRGPIRLMAGASPMVSSSKLGRQHRPSGSWVQ
jgi:hypothetical protein